MKLYAYQTRLVDAVVADLQAGLLEVLLAACPGAGKTEMALAIVDRFLPSGGRALVLAHWTKVLKSNFQERLDRDDWAHVKPRVDIRNPQERRSITGKYDLLVVDEAHEGYVVEDGLVAEIKRKTGAKQVLLLTGSPSKFIGRKEKPLTEGNGLHAFALEELHSAQAIEGIVRVADVMVELGTSAYRLGEKDWNESGDVKQAAARHYTAKATTKTLDDLLKTLAERLKLQGHRWGFKDRLVWKTVATGWNKVLGGLKKTVIACEGTKMADQVHAYFVAKGVNCVKSHSENEDAEDAKESANIARFKADPDIALLVVANRAQLGFDMWNLVNFVDLTGTKSANRIFQMLCRVVRTPADQKPWDKLFVKVMPAVYSPVNLRFFMSGVLTLAQHHFFATWDGIGGELMRERVPEKRERSGKRGEKKGTKPEHEPYLEAGMMVWGDYFQGLGATYDQGYEPFAWVRLGETLGLLGPSVESTKKELLEFRKNERRWPSQYAQKGSEEWRLWGALARYCQKTHGMYDAGFDDLVRSLGYGKNGNRAGAVEKKKKILEFVDQHGRPPARGGSKGRGGVSAEENRLAGNYWSYITASSSAYDPEFAAKVRAPGVREEG